MKARFDSASMGRNLVTLKNKTKDIVENSKTIDANKDYTGSMTM